MSNGTLEYQLAKLHQKRLMEDAKPIEIPPMERPSRPHGRYSTKLVRLGSVAAIVTVIVLVFQQ